MPCGEYNNGLLVSNNTYEDRQEQFLNHYLTFLAMHTAYPTTRSALSFRKFRNRPLDMSFPRLRFFGSDSPAYPLIATQWRKVLPTF